MIENIESIAVFIIGAVVYSFVVFFAKKTKGEKFNPRKVARTILVGVIIGMYAYSTGTELTLMNWYDLLHASGAAVVADQVVKAIWRLKPWQYVRGKNK